MTDETRRFRLGLFVIGGLLLLAGGILAVSAGRIFQKTTPLYCYFQESVQGLDQGSPVKFRGVQIGRVESINVMPGARIAAVNASSKEASLIEARCELFVDKISDQSTRIVDKDQIDASIAREVKRGLRVRIAWKDITGLKYLDLDYTDPKDSPERTLPFTPPGTYIPTATEKSFTDIQHDVASVTSQLAQVDYKGITEELKALLGSLRTTSERIEAQGMVAKLGEAAEGVRDLAKDPRVASSLARLDSTLERLDSAAKRLDDLLAKPALGTALDDAAATAASLRRISGQFEDSLPKLTKSLDETLAAARRALDESKLADTTSAARATMTDVATAARQMSALRESARKTLVEFGNASRDLGLLVKYVEENPNALLRGKTEEAR